MPKTGRRTTMWIKQTDERKYLATVTRYPAHETYALQGLLGYDDPDDVGEARRVYESLDRLEACVYQNASERIFVGGRYIYLEFDSDLLLPNVVSRFSWATRCSDCGLASIIPLFRGESESEQEQTRRVYESLDRQQDCVYNSPGGRVYVREGHVFVEYDAEPIYCTRS